MAGDWIKMRGNLWDDPRVSKIVDMTDSSEAAVIGALYWLWAMADQHTEDGLLHGLTLTSIDRKTGVKGFAAALCAIEWIAESTEGISIVDFEKHNGTSAKKRCQTAKRVAVHAAANAGKDKPDDSANAASVSSALAREEKRREEIEVTEAKASDGEPSPMTDKEKIWTYGVPILVNAGSTDKAARSFLGGLVKGHDEGAVVQALRDCIRAKPLQPLEWLAAALPPAGSVAKKNKQEQLEQRNRAVADAWAKQPETINATE